jgi:hypothetical protein
MPVVVTAVAPFTPEQYDAVTDRVMPGGELPEGCQLHVAGPVAEGFRVITIWDSADDFHEFRQQKLLPAIEEVSGQEPSSVIQPQVDPVHRLITS